VDQEIELAEPNFTPLPPEEMAQAVSLLAALICTPSWASTGSTSTDRTAGATDP
jgi:hypothetical protein